VFVLVGNGLPLSHAATLWTGTNINFTESANSKSDVILAGKVVLTRGSNQVLYNTAAGETSAGASSPADTKWAFGTLTNFTKLSYQSLESIRIAANGDLAGRILNQQMVMHLTNEDIYLSVRFTAWGQHGAGGFAYTRSTPVMSVQPTVSITGSTGANVILTWPTNSTTFTLQSTTNFGSPGVWTAVSPGPVVVNGLNTVTNPISATQQFYRLGH
jgi:archaellin